MTSRVTGPTLILSDNLRWRPIALFRGGAEAAAAGASGRIGLLGGEDGVAVESMKQSGGAAAQSARKEELTPFADVLLQLGAADDRVIVLAGDLARYVEVLPFADAYPRRFFNLGMAEANIIGMASGLAKSGLKPIVVTYGVFITRRPYDQVAMSLTTGPTGVVLVGFLPGITCRFRASHQPIEDIALMAALPSMHVVDPADDRELRAAVRTAVGAGHPTYIRALRGRQPPLPVDGRPPEECRPVILGDRDGELGLIATGLGTQWALEAAAVLRARGRSAAILHLPVLKPFDGETVLAFSRRYSHLVTVENHVAHGGLFAAVAAVLAQNGLSVRVVPAAIPDAWPPSGTVEFIRKEIGLDAEAIAARALAGRRERDHAQ